MDDSIIQAANDERVMKPITGDFLRLPVPNPNSVQVRINGHLAACQDKTSHCTFVYSSQVTPRVTAMSPSPGSVVRAGDVLTLTGSDLAPAGSGQTQVAFGEPSYTCDDVVASDNKVSITSPFSTAHAHVTHSHLAFGCPPWLCVLAPNMCFSATHMVVCLACSRPYRGGGLLGSALTVTWLCASPAVLWTLLGVLICNNLVHAITFFR
jgi:hypothetical protein